MFGKRFKRSLPIWSLTLGLSLISGCIIQIGDDLGGPLVPPIPSEFPSDPGELRPPGSSASAEALDFIDPLKSFYSVGQTLNLQLKRQMNVSESRLLNSSELVFTTSDDTIASVDVNGVLRFLKPGQITLKVFLKSNPEIKREELIEVTQQLDVLDISVQPSDDFIELGKTRQLNAVVTLPDGTRNGNVTWSSEDTRIASVSESGEIVAHREGVVSIVATYSPNTRYKGRLDLKVVKELPPAPLPTPIVFSPIPTPTPIVTATPIPTPQPVVSPITPTSGAVTLPGDFRGQLVYSSDKDGDQEIYRLTTAGLTQLTQNKAYDATPAISPDGKQIAFVSNQDGNNEIYLMQNDGSNLRRLTRDPGSDQAPDWSPDGSKLVFTSNRGGTEELYIMDADGSGVVALTQGALAIHPRWSPLGDKITFSSYRDGDTEIYTINSDGKGLKQLTFNSVGDTLPAWAPDGQRILFQSSRNITTGLTLYQIRVDGSAEAQVFQQTGTDAQGAFSPSGQQLAFISQRNGQIDLYLLNLGSGVFSRITQDLASEGHPDWGKL